MEKTIQFESDLVFDLSLYKEFTKINSEAYGKNTFFRFISVCCVLYLLFNLFDVRITPYAFLVLSLFYIVLHVFQLLKNKDGGLAYKQLLHGSNNNVPHQLVTFTLNGITSKNIQTENQTFESYANIKYVMESKNLLILVNNIKLALILDKRTLNGGSRDEFLAFLQENCPQMKKRVITGKLGRFMARVMWALVIIGCILSVATLLQIPEKLSGQLTNDMSYQEMAAELKLLDITISPQTIAELEALDVEYQAEYGGEYYRDNSSESKIFDMLYWEAAGFYDSETWEWTPSTSGIYWFDTEAWNADTIYSDFLTGVSAMHDDLCFTNVQEDYSQVDFEAGTGIVVFSFDWHGDHYIMEAEYNFDWFDTKIMEEICRIIEEDNIDKDLYFAFDGGQGYLLYYGSSQQVRLLQLKSGLYFTN